MKILFFASDLFGQEGEGRYSLNLVSALNKIGVDVVCLVNKKNDKVNVRQIEVLRPKLRYLNTRPYLLFFDLFKIKKIIEKEKPDIIHFLAEPYALFSLFIRNINAKKILSVHGTYIIPPKKSIFRPFAKYYYGKIDKIIVGSSYTKKRLIEIFPEVENKIEVIFYSINLLGAKITYPNNKIKKVFFIGAVIPRKGVKESILSLGEYYKKYGLDFEFNIAGKFNPNGIYEKELMELVNELGISNKVKFLGKISEEEKEKLFKEADLFIMLSKILDNNHFEGFGLVYLEANKYGCPTIGPNVGGPTDAIKDGHSGFQVDVFDSGEVAEKINLILNKGAIERENCFEWANEHNIEKNISKFVDIYNDVLEN